MATAQRVRNWPRVRRGFEVLHKTPYPLGESAEGYEVKDKTPYPLGESAEGFEVKDKTPYPLGENAEGYEVNQNCICFWFAGAVGYVAFFAGIFDHHVFRYISTIITGPATPKGSNLRDLKIDEKTMMI